MPTTRRYLSGLATGALMIAVLVVAGLLAVGGVR